jgi:hypothetical protein
MTGLTGVAAAAFAASAGKLFFLHVGNQKPNQFDNDNPVLVGMDGLKEFVSILYVLEKMQWTGHVEFDNHMLRTDTAPGKENARTLRRRFIELDVEAYRLAERAAHRLVENGELGALQDHLWNSHHEVAELLQKGDPKSVLALNVYYTQVNHEPQEIGRLDLLVDRLMLGMDHETAD